MVGNGRADLSPAIFELIEQLQTQMHRRSVRAQSS